MKKMIEILADKSKLVFIAPVRECDISDAERELQLHFTMEYKEYLLKYGVASFLGHELTGICNSNRLNVVKVTKEKRNNINNIPMNWYVVEETNIDSVTIWQASDGSVYQVEANGRHMLIASSLAEYLGQL